MDKILKLLSQPVLAIRPEALGAIAARLINPKSATALQPFALSSHATARTSNAPKRTMIIPIEGTLTNDEPWWGTTYTSIQGALALAAEDTSIESVILNVDSPGGETTGLQETADAIFNLAKTKPVRAMVTGMAASAAYWLVSQASDITVTPSGDVGSVGVRATHVDVSEALTSMGLKVTEMHAGKFKTEFTPFAPLSDESKAYMQTLLDSTYQQFQDAIARGRGSRVSASMRADRYANGRMVPAEPAKKHGLVDAVMSARDFYRIVSSRPAPMRKSALNDAGTLRARLELAKRHCR